MEAIAVCSKVVFAQFRSKKISTRVRVLEMIQPPVRSYVRICNFSQARTMELNNFFGLKDCSQSHQLYLQKMKEVQSGKLVE